MNYLGDYEVDPQHDVVADLYPSHIIKVSLSINSVVDVINEAKLAEGEVKEEAPSLVIRIIKIQSLQHMGVNIDQMNYGDSDRHQKSNLEGADIMVKGKGVGGGRV